MARRDAGVVGGTIMNVTASSYDGACFIQKAREFRLDDGLATPDTDNPVTGRCPRRIR